MRIDKKTAFVSNPSDALKIGILVDPDDEIVAAYGVSDLAVMDWEGVVEECDLSEVNIESIDHWDWRYTVKEIRVQSGLSQKSFADKWKIPLRTLQSWEIGERRPTLNIVYMLDLLNGGKER